MITEEQLKQANPLFFWPPMVEAMGPAIPTLKKIQDKYYYFVRYEDHTTVYDICPNTLELTAKHHIKFGQVIDLDKI